MRKSLSDEAARAEVRTFKIRAGALFSLIVLMVWAGWYVPRGRSRNAVVELLDAPKPPPKAAARQPRPPADASDAAPSAAARPTATSRQFRRPDRKSPRRAAPDVRGGDETDPAPRPRHRGKDAGV